MSELKVNTIRPVSGTTLTVSNDTNLTVAGTGKVTTPLVEAADLDINGTSSLELKFNNNTKLAVTNTGATVTGTMTATAFSGDGSGLTGITSAGTGGTSSSGNLQLISNSGGANGARDIVFLDQNSEKARLYGATGNLAVNTDTLFVDATNNRVGIGKTTPASTLDVNGTCTATSFVGSNLTVTGNITGSTVGALAASLLPSGSVLQVVEAFTTTITDFTSTTGWAAISGMSVTITPKRATSKIFVIASWQTWLFCATTGASWISARIMRGATPLSTHGAVFLGSASESKMSQLCIFDSESSPGTSAVTYSLQLQTSRGASGTTYNPQAVTVGWQTALAPPGRHQIIVVEVAV